MPTRRRTASCPARGSKIGWPSCNSPDRFPWPAASNWLGGTPNGVGAVAKFGSAIGGASTVQLSGAKTVGGVIFDSSESYTIAGTDSLTINNGAAGGSIVVNSGSHTVSAPVALGVDVGITSLSGATLTFTGAISGAKTLTLGGSPPPAPAEPEFGAIDFRGATDLAASSAQAVPEPGTATLLLSAVATLAGMRRRKNPR